MMWSHSLIFDGFTHHSDSLGMAHETHPFNCLHLEILLTITIIVRQLKQIYISIPTSFVDLRRWLYMLEKFNFSFFSREEKRQYPKCKYETMKNCCIRSIHSQKNIYTSRIHSVDGISVCRREREGFRSEVYRKEKAWESQGLRIIFFFFAKV